MDVAEAGAADMMEVMALEVMVERAVDDLPHRLGTIQNRVTGSVKTAIIRTSRAVWLAIVVATHDHQMRSLLASIRS